MANLLVTWTLQADNPAYSPVDHWVIRESFDAGLTYSDVVGADNIPGADTSIMISTPDGQKYYQIVAVDAEGDESNPSVFQHLASTVTPLPVATVDVDNV